MNKKGFTLIELLAVVAILAILAIIALPNILDLYKETRKNAFLSEVQSIYDSAAKQYMLNQFNGTNEEEIYTNISSGRKLDLQGGTGGSDFKYCVVVNESGKITNISVTNGTFKYESNNIMDNADITYVSNVGDDYAFNCEGATAAIQFVTRQNTGQITVGDEVSIGSENFYVISSDATNTVLLSKYNILVGDVYEYDSNTGGMSLKKTLSPSDAGYGLQSSSAKGFYGSSEHDKTGVVPFSGKGYWDNAGCTANREGYATCSGTSGLKSEYSNESNSAGRTGGYSTPYPYVYNSTMSSVAPDFIYGRYAQDNGYTVAYFVEEYVNTLKGLGAPSNITGRLLSNEEATSLPSNMKGNWSYWLGSASYNSSIRYVHVGTILSGGFWLSASEGVRPVIVVSTSDIES